MLGGSVVYTHTKINNWKDSPRTTSNTVANETNIFNYGRLVAKMKTLIGSNSTNQFTWSHVDPMSTVVGESANTGGAYLKDILDPNGSGVGLENPYPEEPEETKPPRIWDESGNGEMGFGEMVEVDGVLMNRGQAERLSAAGVTSQCPREGCGAQMTENGWAYWTAYADGYAGYLPMGANYQGNGQYTMGSTSRQAPTLKNRFGQRRPAVLPFVGNEDAPIGSQDDNVDPPSANASPDVRSRQRQKLLTLIRTNVTLIGFTADQRVAIRKSLHAMFTSQPCVDAFRRAKDDDDNTLKTPAEIVRDNGVQFVHFNALKAPLSDELKALGWTEDVRAKLRYETSGSAELNGGGWTVDPKAEGWDKPIVTVLYDSSFKGGPFKFSEIMPHEAIHRSGVSPYYTFGYYKHDLSRYSSYADIIKHCTFEVTR